jgi:hypothetical protein
MGEQGAGEVGKQKRTAVAAPGAGGKGRAGRPEEGGGQREMCESWGFLKLLHS